MTELSTVRVFSCAVLTPLAIPMVFFLHTHWRYPLHIIRRIAVVLELLLIAATGLIYHTFGSTLLTCTLIGTALPAACALVLLYCSTMRDGRMLFTLVTMGLDVSICDVVTSFFAARSDPLWPVLKAVIYLLQGVLILCYLRAPFARMLSSDRIKWSQLSAIPLALCVTLTGYYLEALTPEGLQIPVFPALVLCICSVMVYLTLYRFQNAMLRQMEVEQFNALLRTQLEFLHRQTELAQEAAERFHIFQHDIRHFVRLLRGCLAQEDLPAAELLLDHMEKSDAPACSPLTEYTGDTLMDTILTHSAQQAKRAGVDFSVSLTLPQTLRVDRWELAVALSNAVENAIQAAAQEDGERIVSIHSLPARGELFLVISNSFSGQVVLDEQTHLPKSGTPGHGYGTHSMSTFAAKYGCLMDCTVQNKVFTLRLLI